MTREGAITTTQRRARWLCGAALAVTLWPAAIVAQPLQPVRGEAQLTASGGFARLVISLREDVDADVSVAGSVLVLRFKRPVDVPVDALGASVPDYVNAARRDPDGSAIRLALQRKVSVNTMVAGERLFIDLLPDGWKGPPPPLPQEVVRELAERARAAERALRAQRASQEAKKIPPVRVRVSTMPTFVRFVFDLPEGTTTSSALGEQKLTLVFNAPLQFDFADVKVQAPTNIGKITQEIDGNTARVDIGLVGGAEVRAFREDKSYVVDFSTGEDIKIPALPPAAAATPAPPQAKPGGNVASPSPKAEAAPPAPAVSPARDRGSQQATERPAPEQPAPVAAAPAEAPPRQSATSAARPAEATRTSAEQKAGVLEFSFRFAAPTPAAMFRRADAIWLLFDAAQPVDVEGLRRGGGSTVAEVTTAVEDNAQLLRIRLNRPQLASLSGETSADGRTLWQLQLADSVQAPAEALQVMRNVSDPARATVSVPLASAGRLHRLVDPGAGSTLTVATALPPGRGIVRRQDFVEFSLLETMHGIAIQTNADDVKVDLTAEQVVIGRPGGLAISPSDAAPGRGASAARPMFDPDAWRQDQVAAFAPAVDRLIAVAGAANPNERLAARMDLARFYMARGFYHEAKGVLDLALSSDQGRDAPHVLKMHALASLLCGRTDAAQKDLASPALATAGDTELLKALVAVRKERWAEAREKFKTSDFAITMLPPDIQRPIIVDAARASLESRDYAGAAARVNDLSLLGVPDGMQPRVAVLRGQIAQAFGRNKDALADYQAAAASPDRLAATEARLLELALRHKTDGVDDDEMLRQAETLQATWRGDALEVRALHMMAKLYDRKGRYREALMAARTATQLQPDSELSRELQDDASTLFSQVFRGSKGDELPPVEALAMFYEFRELTPIGRRGDEMIRRLADRLVAVDLLDQASELLQYQVDNRLEGAARAQVAARLAMVYLMNRKPDRAAGVLRSTRIADLAGELRQQRLLLEARAQSDLGRHDLALDIVSTLDGREAIRLKSDIYWAARRWRESAEQVELLYGDRWREFQPLSTDEKSDILRATIGYALAEDALGLTRLREKYAPKMSEAGDRLAFDLASKPADASSAEFTQIAKMAAAVDTLDGFLRELRARFPDNTSKLPPSEATHPDPSPTGALPAATRYKSADMR